MSIKGLERFKPNTERPPGFLRFWDSTVAKLAEIAPKPEILSTRDRDDGLRLLHIAYTSLGGVRIRGYLLRPISGQPRPLVVHAHGYRDRYEHRVDWARRGVNVFGFDARGFGRSASAISVSGDGYLLTGIESPATSILRGAVADYIQAVRVARELLDDEAGTVCLYGFSFGGALALMAAAVGRGADFVVLGQPTFGWNEERRRLALGGSALEVKQYVEKYRWRHDTVTGTLRYFDSLNFAPLIRAPTLVGIGLDDDVVPSRTVLAIVNHMRCPIEVRLLPVSHSDDPRESRWQAFHGEWLGYFDHGVPADFGAEPRQIRTLLGDSRAAGQARPLPAE